MTEACEQPLICRRNRVDDRADSIDLATPRKRKREPGKPGIPTIQTPEGRAGPAHFPQTCAQGPRDSAHSSARLPRLGHSGAGLTRAGPAEPALPHPGLTRLGAAEDSRPGRSAVPGLARVELALEPRGPAQHQPLQRQLHERPQREQVECERQRRARLGQRGLRTPAPAAVLRPPPHPPAAPLILRSGGLSLRVGRGRLPLPTLRCAAVPPHGR